jgi:hypothetical protein
MTFLGGHRSIYVARKPEPPKQPISWDTHRASAKAKHIGTVKAPDEREAIERAAKEFKQPATKLMAMRWR